MNFSPDFYLKDPDIPTSDKVPIDDPNFTQVLNLLDEHYIDMCNLYYTINASEWLYREFSECEILPIRISPSRNFAKWKIF